MARRYLQLSPAEWAALSWAHQAAYLEGFYEEKILERPEPAAWGSTPADTSVPGDVRSLTAAGATHRAIEAVPFDIGAMIAGLEKNRKGGVA
jgi:hypothetical protein